MSTFLRIVVVFLLLAAGAAPAHADERVIDLAQTPRNQEIEVGTGQLDVTLINKLPFRDYTISCVHESLLVQGLPPLAPTPAMLRTVPSDCTDLHNAITQLAAVLNESDVPNKVAEVRRSLGGTCTDAPIIARANALIDKTVAKKVCSAKMAAADELRVEVRRAPKKAWDYTFAEPSAGVWFPTYGFTFLPNEDERYFTRASTAEEGKFEVLRQSDDREYDFLPSILFNYLPKKWRTRVVSVSLLGGLGVDTKSDLTILFGASALIHQNLSLVGGVAVHEQQRLVGHLQVGDLVGENLTVDQLVDETYDTNVFFGMALRFGDRPKTHDSPK